MDMNRAEGGLKETVGRLQDAAGAVHVHGGSLQQRLRGKLPLALGRADGGIRSRRNSTESLAVDKAQVHD